MAKKQIDVIINKFIEAIKARDIRIEAAYLFGSYANNSQSVDSDIDIAIISPDFGKDFFDESVLLKKISLVADFDISPRPYSTEEFKNAQQGSFLRQEIIQKGVKVPV